jgi:hypothetical protein
MRARPTTRIILVDHGWNVKVFLTNPPRSIGLPNLGRAGNERFVALLL